ncbi:lipopolysaccharide biosynthesis protein [Frateuria hangzhouensis]|uniref:lipopolysaccharide biosynthesis protein n=1 Tax=Frateuria hangzhouensis TaxID=2995589 RepID=UPI002260CF20|nr:oligosaccharide flippase family protein [Frateuria sp. STR12]MCX7515311.1 oligosaccharide flippase family protein [Frateuria sp. STR12]
MLHRFVRNAASGSILASSVRTFVTRSLVAVGSVLLAIVVGRVCGREGLGWFYLSQAALLLVSIIGRRGSDQALMRFMVVREGAVHGGAFLQQALRFGVTASSVLSGFIVCCTFAWPTILGHEARQLLVPTALAVIPFTAAWIYAGGFKAARKPSTACLFENGAVSFLAAVLLFGINSYAPSSWPRLALAGWSFFAASTITCAIAVEVHRRTVSAPTVEKVSGKEFTRSCNEFALMTVVAFFQQNGRIFITGALLSAGEVGLFSAAERAALLIGFVQAALNMVVPPIFSDRHRVGDLLGLERIARKAALGATLAVVPLVAACLALPELILKVFGEEFGAGANVLRIIALAQLINVATGSVGFVLNMTGNERSMRNLTLTSTAITLASYPLLVYFWGLVGAATGLVVTALIQNGGAVYLVRRRLGIWTLPALGVQRNGEAGGKSGALGW